MTIRRFTPNARRHLLALAIPLSVTIVVPALLQLWAPDTAIGWGLPEPLNLLPPLVGGTLIAAGLLLAAWSVTLFGTEGRGTLAPWDPTRRLVLRGPYRYVRNPMISGVAAILLGEAALFGSPRLVAWFALFFAVNAVYIPLAEEPGLVRRFGDEYLAYKETVPRWIPRLSPWGPEPDA